MYMYIDVVLVKRFSMYMYSLYTNLTFVCGVRARGHGKPFDPS